MSRFSLFCKSYLVLFLRLIIMVLRDFCSAFCRWKSNCFILLL